MKRPFGSYMIGFLYAASGIITILSGFFLILNSDKAEQLGFTSNTEILVSILLGIIALFVVYAYMSMTNWGFWVATIYFSLSMIWKLFLLIAIGAISISFLLPIAALIQIIIFRNEFGKEKNK